MSYRIAFVASTRNPSRFRHDPSYIYRCENLAHALDALGQRTQLIHLHDFPMQERFDLVVFHRPRWSLRLAFLLRSLKRFGTTTIADIDDLIFDPRCARYNPGVMNQLVPLRQVRRLYRRHQAALQKFDRITVATRPLADEISRRWPEANTSIVPNAIFHAWRGQAMEDMSRAKDGQRILTYFPGTRSHDRDFTLIQPAVEAFLHQYPDIKLRITGHLDVPLRARPGQIEQRAKVSFTEYAKEFRSAWVNLAPLERTPFNRCKSALKVTEAAYWGVPTLCSAIPDAQRLTEAGAIPVAKEEDWYGQLEAFLEPDFYHRMTHNLTNRIVQHADIDQIADDFMNFSGITR